MVARNANKASKEVVHPESEPIDADIVQSTVFSDDELRSAQSIQDLVSLANRVYGNAALDASETLGDGFTLIRDLTPIAERPAFLLEWTFRDGDFGKYVTIRFAVPNDDRMGLLKYVYNDGSTGIREQLHEVTQKTNRFGNMWVKGGFRVSEYDYEDPNTGEKRPAKTWYLNV